MGKLAAPGYIPKTRPVVLSQPEAETRFRMFLSEILPTNSGRIHEYNYIIRKAKERGWSQFLTDSDMIAIMDAVKSEWFPEGQPSEFE